MLRFVPNLLETKKMYNAVIKLPILIKCIPDCYKMLKCVIKLF